MPGKTNVSIIGMGNWGTSLAHACRAAKIPLAETIGRSTKKTSGWPLIRLEDASLDARILWICVRDAEIVGVAESIAAQRKRLDGQIVVHSSGALSVAPLDSVKRRGAEVASLAPVMSFPTRTPVPLSGVLFAVEARAAIDSRMNALVRKLGGKPFPVRTKEKPLYHAAATMASPLLVSHFSAALAMARLAGLSDANARQWIAALAQATMKNIFERGEGKSFSGAFARGDIETIRLHLQSLQQHPMLREIYISLARHAVETLPVQNRKELESLLRKDRRGKFTDA
ncbi:MAG TPA: Rossmann-like and DUF2520 domain-containing protein [Alloacidobacterium sp.]|nr:Rossmann-like and DUF2520 domain-containing protein [Alloacidobacterium sp.]